MKLGVLRPLLAASAALSIVVTPAVAEAVSVGPAAAPSTAKAKAARSATIALSARNARLVRANRVLKFRLARERRESASLRREVTRLQRKSRGLSRRVNRLLAQVRELKLKLIYALGPWRKSVASTYGIGDGLLGSGLAGRGRLTPERPVFAHKTMAFGTKVQFSYGKKTFVGECQDRGPFIAGREFDLGPRIARELGFGGVGSVKWRTVKKRKK